MKFINVGKIVNTHGIKGELRILSKFRYKDKVFKKGMNLYVGKKKEKFTINTYRFHKIFDMVTFNGFNNINDVLYLKNEFVYINEEDLVLDDDEFLEPIKIPVKKVFEMLEDGTIDDSASVIALLKLKNLKKF